MAFKAEIKDQFALYHPFFDYLHTEEKEEIARDLEAEKTLLVFFADEGVNIFAVVLDFLPGRLHIREAGGKFWRNIETLWVLCLGFMSEFKATALSISGKSRAACRGKAIQYGFIPFEGDYILRFN